MTIMPQVIKEFQNDHSLSMGDVIVVRRGELAIAGIYIATEHCILIPNDGSIPDEIPDVLDDGYSQFFPTGNWVVDVIEHIKPLNEDDDDDEEPFEFKPNNKPNHYKASYQSRTREPSYSGYGGLGGGILGIPEIPSGFENELLERELEDQWD